MGSCCLCVCVIKLILGILNTVILLGGLIVAGIGGALIGLSKGSFALILQGIIYSIIRTLNLVESNALDNVTSTDFTQYLRPTGIALVIIGGFIAAIALLGYCGTSFTILLKIYMLIIGVLVVCEIVLVAVFFSGTFNSKFIEAANFSLVHEYVSLTDGGIFSMAWNIIMIEVKCCGLTGYKDFYYIEHSWPQNRTLKIGTTVSTYLLETPLACCKTSGDYPAIKFIDDYCAISPNETNSNWNTGCWDKVGEELHPYRSGIIFGCSLAIIIQVIIVLMAFLIVRDSSGTAKVAPT